MPAPAQSSIHINTICSDIQCIYSLFQQNRYMHGITGALQRKSFQFGWNIPLLVSECSLDFQIPFLHIPEFKFFSLPGEYHLFLQSGELTQGSADQYTPGDVHFDIAGITDDESLQTANLGIETGKTAQLFFYRLPLRLGIYQQTSGRISGNDNIACAAVKEFITIPGRDRKSSLVIETQLRDTAKHSVPFDFSGGACLIDGTLIHH